MLTVADLGDGGVKNHQKIADVFNIVLFSIQFLDTFLTIIWIEEFLEDLERFLDTFQFKIRKDLPHLVLSFEQKTVTTYCDPRSRK